MASKGIDYYGALKFAKILSEQENMSLILEEQKEGQPMPIPRTTGKQIFMPKPHPKWGELEWAKFWGSLYHEIGHCVPEMRRIFDLMKEKFGDKSWGTRYGRLVNMVDDYRQEHHNIDKWEGRRDALSEKGRIYADAMLDDPKFKALCQNQTTLDQSELISLLAYDAGHRKDWLPGFNRIAYELPKMLGGKAKEYYDKMMAGDYYSPLNEGVPSAETDFNVVDRIIKEVFDENKEREQEKKKAEQQAKQDKENKEKGEGGKPEESFGGKPEKGGGDPLGEYELVSSHSEQSGEADGITPSGRTPGAFTGGDYEMYTPDEISFVDYTKGEVTQLSSFLSDSAWSKGNRKRIMAALTPAPTVGSFEDEVRTEMEIRAGIEGCGLSRQVERLLMIYSKDRYRYGKKKGRLHFKNLYRATMKDARGFNERIFKQKENNDMLDVAVSVLVDCSGSMAFKKYKKAGQCLVLLNDILKVIRIPYELAGFTDYYGAVHYVWKGFNDPSPSTDKLIENIVLSAHLLHENADPDSLLIAYHRLLRRGEKRKVLIVLSDGGPAGGRTKWTTGWVGHDMAKVLKTVCRQIEKEGVVDLYSIGIEDDSVRHFYSHCEVVKQASELEPCLLNLVKRKIII